MLMSMMPNEVLIILSIHHLFTNQMPFLISMNIKCTSTCFSICTIFRENVLPVLKNQVLAVKLLLIGSLVFKNWHYVLPADGTHVPKYVREALIMFVLIRMCVYW